MDWITKDDITAWKDGKFATCYRKLGAHPVKGGTWFAVWAPHADRVSVVGDFNEWKAANHRLEKLEDGGLWQLFVPKVSAGARYKLHIERGDYQVDKTDPYAFAMEAPSSEGSPTSGLASIVVDPKYDWKDHAWMTERAGPETLSKPVSIYEVHLGSWKRRATATHSRTAKSRSLSQTTSRRWDSLTWNFCP